MFPENSSSKVFYKWCNLLYSLSCWSHCFKTQWETERESHVSWMINVGENSAGYVKTFVIKSFII